MKIEILLWLVRSFEPGGPCLAQHPANQDFDGLEYVILVGNNEAGKGLKAISLMAKTPQASLLMN